MTISLKLSSTVGQEKITVSGDILFSEFISLVSTKTLVPIESCQISSGYPPKVVTGEADNILSSFSSIANGCVVLVREGQPPSLATKNETKNCIAHLVSIGFTIAVCEEAAEIAGDNINLAVEIAENITAGSGGTAHPDGSAASVGNNLDNTRKVTRKVIDADNSCLFNALGYLMERNAHQMAPVYRRVIADEILRDGVTYSSEILGMTVGSYVSWILNPEKWGGEIEMNILSKHLRVQIAAVDIQTGKLYIYGQSSESTKRVYLLYDGIHYDAIISSSSSGDEMDDITIFSASDESIEKSAGFLASDLKCKKQFVNMAGCDLKCLVCSVGLRGQKEAQSHAKATGHQNFGQVDSI